MNVRGMLAGGGLFGLWALWAPSGALAAAAAAVSPCSNVSVMVNGVTQEYCVPVSSSAPLPGVPLYSYASAGAAQWALAVGTNTTLTVPTGALFAEICVETASVRYTDDGTSASTTNGILAYVSGATPNCFGYSGPLAAMKFTAVSGSPTISVSYYKAK